MTLAQLRYFCTAARCHSITKAAGILSVTQPTVSIAIRDLEKEFSLTLFTHANNRLSLTGEGEIFYKKASGILSQCDDLTAEYSSRMTGNQIRLGISPVLGTIFFPELLDAFHEMYPDIWVDLQEYPSVQTCDLVQNDELDLGLVNMEIADVDRFGNYQMSTEPLCLCVSPDHPLAGRSCVDLKELHNQPLILYTQGSVQNQILQTQFSAMEITPRIVMRSSQIATIVKFLKQGKCACFFYNNVLKQMPELTGIPVKPAIEARVGLIWRRGRYIPSGMQAFLDFCRKNYGNHHMKME